MAVDLGFDESGSGDTLLVSMQLSITEQAKKLKRQWRAELHDADVIFWHSKDFGNYSGGVFRHLKNPERRRLLKNLTKLVHRHIEVGVTAKLSLNFYKEHSPPKNSLPWQSPYAFAGYELMLAAYLYMDKFGLGTDVNILVEDGHKNVNELMQIFELFKGIPKESPDHLLNIRTLGKGGKAENPILQAADMLGYSEWQHISGADLVIFDSLHVDGSLYAPEVLDCDADIIDTLRNSISDYKERRRLHWHAKCAQQRKADDAEQRISKFRQDDGAIDKGASRQDTSEVGSRESEKAKKAEA